MRLASQPAPGECGEDTPGARSPQAGGRRRGKRGKGTGQDACSPAARDACGPPAAGARPKADADHESSASGSGGRSKLKRLEDLPES
eukprot:1283830-Alexandrium_andersonii.AAC.1